MKRISIALALLTLTVISRGAAAQEFVPPLANPTTPSFVGLVGGGVPDYYGSNEVFYGAAPIARYQFQDSEKYLFLYGNTLGTNIIEHPWLRTGPTAIYRFGRSNVKDEVVSRMKDVDPSLNLGWNVGAEYVNPDQIAQRARIDFYATTDVTDGTSGSVFGLSLTGWTPTPFMLLGVNAGMSFGNSGYMDSYFGVDEADAAASGLPFFRARSGARDARIAVVGIIPVGDSWIVGAGGMYDRLLGDAADSPIVKDRGSADQFFFGFGGAYAW